MGFDSPMGKGASEKSKKDDRRLFMGLPEGASSEQRDPRPYSRVARSLWRDEGRMDGGGCNRQKMDRTSELRAHGRRSQQ
jgi:hypothetical protein